MEGSPSHRWRLEIESGGYSRPGFFPAWWEGASPDHRWSMEIESGGTRALGIPSLAWADKLSQTSDRLYSCGFPDRQSRPWSATGAGGFEVLIANCKSEDPKRIFSTLASRAAAPRARCAINHNRYKRRLPSSAAPTPMRYE